MQKNTLYSEFSLCFCRLWKQLHVFSRLDAKWSESCGRNKWNLQTCKNFPFLSEQTMKKDIDMQLFLKYMKSKEDIAQLVDDFLLTG